MILKEDEAKTKMCPVMSCREAKSKGSNEGVVLCQASSCMGWRWAPNASPESLEWHLVDGKLPAGVYPKGFCGLGCKVDY